MAIGQLKLALPPYTDKHKTKINVAITYNQDGLSVVAKVEGTGVATKAFFKETYIVSSCFVLLVTRPIFLLKRPILAVHLPFS